ncbi:MAG: hypothetical protein IPP29_18475 [Bacteroidetes bacterium]|nr:hypothetical protein [Bacteroidota bacterium]
MPGIGYTTIPVEDNDGNIYFASNTSFTWPYYVVCKYDSALNQQWLINTGTYFTNDPLEDLPSCSGIVFTNDSNLMVSSTGLDWQLMKVNRFTGDTIWTKYLLDSNAFIGNPPYHVILTLTKTISGKYLATTEAGKLLYIDDNGNVLTTTIISATVLSLYNVIPTMDGGIIAVGTQYFGINGKIPL